jgi:hypothetical protein
MANSGTGGVSAPDAEDGNNIHDEQQNEEERRKSKAQPRGWEDSLIEGLTKLNEDQRRRYDVLISNAADRNGSVSPTYQLGVAGARATADGPQSGSTRWVESPMGHLQASRTLVRHSRLPPKSDRSRHEPGTSRASFVTRQPTDSLPRLATSRW